MIRIRGIVKAAQRVRNHLQAGIPGDEVTHLQHFVRGTVERVEGICSEARITPAELPTRSREAYYFLKKLDINNLPRAESNAKLKPPPALRIKNIIQQQRILLQMISSLAASQNLEETEKQEIYQLLARTVAYIEETCVQHQATPASLAAPSRQTYAWMKFLTDRSHLQLHLNATHRVREILSEMLPTEQKNYENLVVEFSNMAMLYKAKCHRHGVILAIAEGFINASNEVLEAVVTAAVLGKTQIANQVVREFALSEEYINVQMELDLMAEAIAESGRGNCYDLDTLFEIVNHQYFAGQLVKPRLTWNRNLTFRKFAHYERSRDRVVMSKTLDDDLIPQFVVEFVLYHELLHKYHGEKWVNGRLAVHTREFRQDERKFKFYEEADWWLTQFVNG